MIVNVFKKTVTPKNGNKPFSKFVTTLETKTGEKIYCDVHFSEDHKPSKFPCTLTVNKKSANLSTRTISKGDKDYTVHNLWIDDFEESDYIDHSLDDFE